MDEDCKTLDNNYNAAELSHEASDERILSLLKVIQGILTFHELSRNYVQDFLDEHTNPDGSYDFDNPDVEAKAGTLRSMVS
jgi:hypothetical protein